MRVLVQKCLSASVSIDNKVYNNIKKGLVVFVGFTNNDNSEKIDYMINEIPKLRIFEDENGVMNKSLLDVQGEILSISQLTLYGDASNGNRPSYVKAMKSGNATILYDECNKKLNNLVPTKTGVFGADMKIASLMMVQQLCCWSDNLTLFYKNDII